MAIDGFYGSVVASLVGAVVAVVGIFLKDRVDDKNKQVAEQTQIGLQYFSPLRLYLEETYFRLNEIYKSATGISAMLDSPEEREKLKRFLERKNETELAATSSTTPIDEQNIQTDWERCRVLRAICKPDEISQKPDEWFVGEGVYLMSTTYLVACLFYYIKRLKEDRPYIQLSHTDLGRFQRMRERARHPRRKKRYFKDDDTILINLVNDVSRAFLQDHGVYYALQPAIGHMMYHHAQDRLITYAEFCEMIRDSDKRLWFDRLLYYFLDASGGCYFQLDSDCPDLEKEQSRNILNARMRSIAWAINSIGLVSMFLDESVGGGPSVHKRIIGESVPNLDTSQLLTMHDLGEYLHESLDVQRRELQSMS